MKQIVLTNKQIQTIITALENEQGLARNELEDGKDWFFLTPEELNDLIDEFDEIIEQLKES